MDVKVKYRYVKSSPRKIYPIIGFLKNLPIDQANNQLKFINKSAAKPIMELIKSAISAAKDKDLDVNKLIVKSIVCNQGPKLKRRRICSRGRATTIAKRMSHLTLILTDSSEKISDNKKNILKHRSESGTKS